MESHISILFYIILHLLLKLVVKGEKTQLFTAQVAIYVSNMDKPPASRISCLSRMAGCHKSFYIERAWYRFSCPFGKTKLRPGEQRVKEGYTVTLCLFQEK